MSSDSGSGATSADRQFVSVLCHDLRGPLRRVYQLAQLLSPGMNPSESEKLVALIASEAKRGTMLIDSLTRYQSLLGLEVSPRECELQPIVRAACTEVGAYAAGDLQIGSLPSVRTDPARLRFVLERVLENAILFADHSRPLRITIEGQRADDGFVLRITDNGIGIAASSQPLVFQAFRRLHAQDKFQGSGLGLFHSRELLNALGGEIGVESEPDKGSTFWVRLNEST